MRTIASFICAPLVKCRGCTSQSRAQKISSILYSRMKLPSLSVAVISPLTVLALSAAAGIWLHLLPRNRLPQHLKGHPVLVEPDLISK